MATTDKTSKAEQSETTRRALLSTARRLFTEKGFAATGTDELVEQSGVTRGALYYHFRDKRALFQAVDEELEAEIAERIATVALEEIEPWDQLIAGALAYLDTATDDPAVRQVLLIDGPSVLGWNLWREIDLAHASGMLVAGLEAAMDAGTIERHPAGTLANVLLGALNEACLTIANADNKKRARREVGAVVRSLLDGLRQSNE